MMKRVILMACIATSALLLADAPSAAAQEPPQHQPFASSPPSTSSYNDETFGPWLLRSDSAARTLDLPYKGVVELSAKLADGTAEWYLLDNGVVLRSVMAVGGCTSYGEVSYPDVPGSDKPLDQALIGSILDKTCESNKLAEHTRAWRVAFPAAIEAMKRRATTMFGSDLLRCITPPVDPLAPPYHPRCGFPSNRVGEKEAW